MSQQKIFSTGLTVVDSSAKDNLGTIRWEGGKAYKYVQILNATATVSGVAGDAVLYFAATGYTSNRVVLDATDGDTVPFGAGLLVGTVTGTAGTAEYGWIQIKGAATVAQTIAGTTPADGQGLAASTTDKTLTLHTNTGAGADGIRNVGQIQDASAKLVACDFPF